ncbi:MAG TPA: UMP kinase [Erysipelotrichaceae bacterium]|nr:UMP kinase [Erysipelotrichaceae bacterium]HQA85285.1 UMP kinase [Erysipelotrichaceae bacterium]
MYKRVLLKLSGEALSSKETTFSSDMLKRLALQLKKVTEMGVQVAIVVGGGNIMRGKFAAEIGLPRVEADKMGMLGTMINALAVCGACQENGLHAYMQSAVECTRVCDIINYRKAVEVLENGGIVVYGGGTGNPYFSTDTASALRASEIGCQAILMAKNGVDGVYSSDPRKDPTAVKFDKLTYQEMIEKELNVMDLTAASMCKDNNIDTIIFNMNEIENISKVLLGEKIGTVVSN